jgi:hypothetical protein
MTPSVTMRKDGAQAADTDIGESGDWYVDHYAAGVPVSPTTHVTKLAKHAEALAPAPGGDLSLNAEGFQWRVAGVRVLSRLRVSGSEAKRRVTVSAETGGVAFARLAALGVAPFAPGQHYLSLYSRDDARVDDDLFEGGLGSSKTGRTGGASSFPFSFVQ